jgi:hypothetical protein
MDGLHQEKASDMDTLAILQAYVIIQFDLGLNQAGCMYSAVSQTYDMFQ